MTIQYYNNLWAVIYSMARIAINIHILGHEKAMDSFMKSERFHEFELPEHFTSDEVLSLFVRRSEPLPMSPLHLLTPLFDEKCNFLNFEL